MKPIRKAYQKLRYTEDQIIDLKRCKKDVFYFIEQFCKLADSESGVDIPMKLYPYQKRLVDAIEDNDRVIALWPRQSGKTEVSAAYMLWFAMFNKKKDVLIAAHKYEHVQEVLRRVKHIYESLPMWLKAGVLDDGYNARSIKFENGSTITGVATTLSSGRGRSIHLLYLDELSFVTPNIQKEFWASIQPTLSATKGKCIITSTPNNDDDEFARIWHQAIDTIDSHGFEQKLGTNGFRAVPAKWDEHPKRNEEWAEKQRKELQEERFRREVLCEFVTFDETLINPVFIATKLPKMECDPVDVTGSVRWYGKIKPNKTYLIALDPAMGTGYDNAAIQIFQLPEVKQVGEWMHNRTDIPGQIRLINEILHYIHTEMVTSNMQNGEPEIYWSVENNVIGEAALIVIDEMGEENFPGTLLTESKSKGHVRAFRRGFNTTNKKKIEACSRLKSMLESSRLHIFSKALIRELKFFVAKGNTYKAKEGATDDLVCSLIIILRMLHELLQWDGELHEAISENLNGGFDDEIIEPMPTMLL